MAKIINSEMAPKEDVSYSFANVSFKIEADGSYETEDSTIIAAAATHPWLEVAPTKEDSPAQAPVVAREETPEKKIITEKPILGR